MTTFPIYLLRFGIAWKVVFPENRADIGHTDFWEQTVSHIVAEHYRIPQKRLANLPYWQKRARVMDNTVYYGGKPDPQLLKTIREALWNPSLLFAYDNHEKRLQDEVRPFRSLVRCHRSA